MLFEFAETINKTIPNTDSGTFRLWICNNWVMFLWLQLMGMFSHLIDHPLWHFIAFSAGTGGSMLIIGSAAGVVAMGMERIDFFWYLKKISWLALVGFISGSLIFILMRDFII